MANPRPAIEAKSLILETERKRQVLIKRIEHSIEARMAKNSVPVEVQDIVALQAKDKYGEHDLGALHASAQESEHQLVHRLYRYIKQLVKIAEKEHVKNNFKVSHQGRKPVFHMLENKQNVITRLLLPEFSLYPNKDRKFNNEQGALTPYGLDLLISKLEPLAYRLKPNMHFMLGTIPVKKGSSLQNVMIFFKSGTDMEIRIVNKTCPYHNDLQYPETNLVGRVAPVKDEVYNEESNLIVTSTETGTKAAFFAEICYDHANKVAICSAETMLRTAQRNSYNVLPTQSAQAVLSSTIILRPLSLMSGRIAHADTKQSRESSATDLGLDYKIAHLTTHDLDSPFFGAETKLYVYPPCKLSAFVAPFAKKIASQNQFHVSLQARRLYRAQRPSEKHDVSREIKKLIFKHFVDTVIMPLEISGQLHNENDLQKAINDIKSVAAEEYDHQNLSIDDGINLLEKMYTAADPFRFRMLGPEIETVIALLEGERRDMTTTIDVNRPLVPTLFQPAGITQNESTSGSSFKPLLLL